MTKKKRRESFSGIYHVMMRGINRQDIFHDESDFLRMMNLIRKAPLHINPHGDVVSADRCHIYAYCVLGNHTHILIREGEDKIRTIMHRINTAYATYYNLRYERVGHLFQGNFESEPVENDEYFKTAFRYIHRNPVKAQDVDKVEDYPYSSWNEYVNHKSNLMRVLQPADMNRIYDFMSHDELVQWVNIDNEDHCLDMNDFFRVRSDKEAWDILSDLTDYCNPEDFRQLDQQTQIFYLLQAIEIGVSVSQASRLGTLSRFQINRALTRRSQGFEELLGRTPRRKKVPPTTKFDIQKNEEALTCVEVDNTCFNTALDKNDIEIYHGRVRQIQSLNQTTYHQLHRIVDYLFEHPASKCADIANHLGICSEAARKHLFRMSNEAIVIIEGKGRNRTYSLEKVGENPEIN